MASLVLSGTVIMEVCQDDASRLLYVIPLFDSWASGDNHSHAFWMLKRIKPCTYVHL